MWIPVCGPGSVLLVATAGFSRTVTIVAFCIFFVAGSKTLIDVVVRILSFGLSPRPR
jgi:hypothetical protein